MEKVKRRRRAGEPWWISVEGIRAINLANIDGTFDIPQGAALDLIRCTMPVPCGVCWYCKKYEERS